MAAVTVNSLIAYIAKSYPQLSSLISVYLSKEFRNIENAISSIEQVLQSGMTGVTAKSGLPATSDLPKGTAGLFKDTSGGGVYLAYNDNGTIKKVALV